MLTRALFAIVLLTCSSLVADEPQSGALFDFSDVKASQQWRAVNDGVMGGRSDGRFRVTKEGTMEFFGTLSLANNGGFASVRSRSRKLSFKEGDTVVTRIKGDGRRYTLNLYVPVRRIAFSYRVEFMKTPSLSQRIKEFKLGKWEVGDEIVFFARVMKRPKALAVFECVNLTNQKRGTSIAVNKKGELLRKREGILEQIKTRVKETAEREKPKFMIYRYGSFTLPLGYLRIKPKDSPLIRDFQFSGLLVPADPEYKEGLLKKLKSEHVFRRSYAAASLVNYPDKEVIALLKNSLNDPGTHTYESSGGAGTPVTKLTYYPVRQAAYDVLTKLGEKVEKPKGYLERDSVFYW